jgi:hypothetical protein
MATRWRSRVVAAVRSAVLGPVEVRRDGRLVPVPGGKASEMLVRLALEAARTADDVLDTVIAALDGDQVEHSLLSVDDPWLYLRRDGMLGELARVEHRFDDAVHHLRHGRDVGAARLPPDPGPTS